MKFNQTGLSKVILKSVSELNYTDTTEIQSKAIPVVLDKRDIMGIAQTGTGKTAAFSLPIIDMIHRNYNGRARAGQPRALVLSPTRELAIQIAQSLSAYAKYTQVSHTVIFGGVKQAIQVNALSRGIDILVATPGRLLDLINQKIIDLSKVEFFVLDEADRMLDMGFIHDIRKVLNLLPVRRQTLFFSATMPDDIVKLSRSMLHKPVRVEAQVVSSSPEKIQQFKYYTNYMHKKDLLKYVLDKHDVGQALVFTRTKRRADQICKYLNKQGLQAMAIHGNKSQNQRQKALKEFKADRLQILVATDIAARGIDVKALKHVINFDIPNISETYVHRIGRSGRAGMEGVAISLCDIEENAYIKNIEKLTGKALSAVEDHPFVQDESLKKDKSSSSIGFRGRARSSKRKKAS